MQSFFNTTLIMVTFHFNRALIKIFMIMPNKRILIIVFLAAFLLLLSLITMHFTSEVNWTSSDFIVDGILLLGTGLLFELVMRNAKKTKARNIFSGVILAILLLIKAEIAVSII